MTLMTIDWHPKNEEAVHSLTKQHLGWNRSCFKHKSLD